MSLIECRRPYNQPLSRRSVLRGGTFISSCSFFTLTAYTFMSLATASAAPFSHTGPSGDDVDSSFTTEFQIDIDSDEIVSDLNIAVHFFNERTADQVGDTSLIGTMAWGDLDVSLSKNDTTVQLWEPNAPGETSDLFVAFDDESTEGVNLTEVLQNNTAPVTTQSPDTFVSGTSGVPIDDENVSASYEAVDKLSAFKGEDLSGTWTLSITDPVQPGEGDALLGWQIYGDATNVEALNVSVSGDVAPENLAFVPERNNETEIIVGQAGSGQLIVDDGGLVTGGLLKAGDFETGEGTVIVSGPNARIELPGDPQSNDAVINRLEIGQLGTGTLLIEDGGVVDASGDPDACQGGDICAPVIANGSGSTGTVTVQDPGSELRTLGIFTVGRGVVDDKDTTDPTDDFGNPNADTLGVLNIENGGKVLATGGMTVAENNSVGEVNITGGGTLESASDKFNNLIIGQGLTSDAPGPASSSGSVTVSGSGSKIVTKGTDNTIQVGRDTTGNLLVEDGARVETLQLEIANSGQGEARFTGDDTSAIVSTEHGRFSGSFDFEAGFVRVARNDGSNGLLVVENGADMEVRAGSSRNTDTVGAGVQIARQAGSFGRMEVDGAGTTVAISQGRDPDLADGEFGSFFTIARNEGSEGEAAFTNGALVTMSGGGSFLSVGRDGKGSLNIESGAQFLIDASSNPLGAAASVGQLENGDGTLVVDGPGSLLSIVGGNNTGMTVGERGNGSLTISNSGRVFIDSQNDRTGGFAIGGDVGTNQALGNSGQVLVTGAGSELETVGESPIVTVGERGIGQLDVEQGGTVKSLGMTVGVFGNGDGTVNVDAQSSLQFTGDDQINDDAAFFVVGRAGQGTANIEGSVSIAGGSNVFPGLVVGGTSSTSGGEGTLNLTGPDAEVSISGNTGFFGIGNNGKGDAYIDNGAQLSGAVFGQVGNHPGSNGTMMVDGASVSLTGLAGPGSGNEGQGAFFGIGSEGFGEVHLTNGSNFTIDPGQTVASGNGSGFNVGGSNSVADGGNGELYVDNSTLTVEGNNAFAAIGNNGSGRLEITNGGQVVMTDTDMSAQTFVGLDDAGSGTVIVDGSGSIFDVGKEFFLGQNAAFEDTGTALVTVRNGGEIRAKTTRVGANAALTGNGTVTGNIFVDGGLVAPGLSPGTLTINGDFTLNGGVLQLEVGDLLDIDGQANLNEGTIDLLFDEEDILTDLNLFQFFENGLIIGDNLQLSSSGFNVTNFNRKTGSFDVAQVPVPETSFLLLIGLASLFAAAGYMGATSSHNNGNRSA